MWWFSVRHHYDGQSERVAYQKSLWFSLAPDTSLTIKFVGRQNEWTIPPNSSQGMTNSPTISQGQDSPLAVKHSNVTENTQ